MAYDTSIRVGAEVDASEVEKKLVKELDKAEKKLDSLQKKADKWETLGVKEFSKQFKALKYDIEQAEGELYEAEEALKSFRQQQEKSEKITFAEALQNAANLVKSSFKMLGNAILHPVETMKTLVNSAKNLGSVLKKAFSGGLKVMTGLLNPMKSIKSLLGGISNQGKKAGNTFSKTSGKLRNIAFSMLAFNAMFKAMNMVTTAFKEGYQNIARYSRETNKVMSEFKSQTTQLKNSLATAFTPVINNIVPILTNLVAWLNKACDAMARFIAYMSGKKTYTKAKEQVVDYAESLDKASGAAKEAAKSLAGFDELNVLSDNSSSSGDGADVGNMFEEAEVGEMPDFAQAMKDAIDKGDWFGAGKLLAEKINEMLVQVDISKFDTDLQGKVKSIVSAVNGAIQNLDWSLLGQKTAEGINVAIHSLETFWQTMDWKALGTGIVSGIVSVIRNIDFKSIGEALSAFVSGILKFLTGAVKGVDWSQVPNTIISAISGFLYGLDYVSIFGSIGGLIGTAIAAGIDLLKGLGSVLSTAWDTVVEYFSKYIELSGGDIVLGLLTGIINALKNIGKWIVDNIFKPFIEGFKSAFEIHSPSKVMKRMGKYLIEGLFGGVKESWKEAKTEFFEILEELKKVLNEKIGTIISGVKSLIEEALGGKEGIVSIWKEAWESVESTVSGIFDSIWAKIKSVLNSILSGIGNMVNKAIDTLNNLIDRVNSISFELPAIMGGGRVGFNITKLSRIEIPQLATGGIVNSPTTALIGEAGREAVLPLENNTQWMDILAGKIASKTGGSGSTTLILEVDKRELGRLVVDLGNKESGRRGISFANT